MFSDCIKRAGFRKKQRPGRRSDRRPTADGMEMLKALRKGASAVDALTYLFATLSGLYVGLLGLLLAKLYEQAALVYRYFFPKRGEDGVKLIIKEATSVPRMDILSESDTYVHVSTVVGGRVLFNTTTPVVPSNVNPQWDCTVFLGDHLWEGSKRPPKDVVVRFEMRDADHVGSDFIGLATVTLCFGEPESTKRV